RWYKKKRNTTIARIPYFRNPWHTQKGNGSIQLQYEPLKTITEDPAILRNVLLFKDDDPLFIRVYNGVARNYEDLATGQYRLVLLVNEGRYFEWDSVLVHPNGINFIRVKEPEVLLAGQLGKKMARLIEKKASYRNYSNSETDEVANQVRREYLDYQTPVDGPVITGVVTDGEGLPLPGVNVFVKGTTIGTITNIDGYYELTIPEEASELVFSFIGFVSKEVPLGYSNQASVSLKEEELHLDEVIVVGYGVQKKQSFTGSVATVTSEALMSVAQGMQVKGSASDKIMIRGISSLSGANQPLYVINGVPYEGDFSQFDQSSILNITVLKDASATALYGARAANGVVIIEIKDGASIPFTKVDIPVGELPMILPAGNKGLRTNFSDEAYWQPNLLTDRKGEVRFKVTFPDDITAWKTYVMAAGTKGHTGAAQSMTKAFLPLSGNLMVPRFLTQGDSLTILGKTINYLPDSMEVHRQFEQTDSAVVSVKGWVNRLAVDSLSVVVPRCDTLAFKYTIETDDFKDGEQREVPVFPVGSMEAKGFFTVLQSDTSLTIPVEAGARSTLRIESNPLEVLISENNYLRSYRYLCNEQAASKLKGLLMEKKICEALDRKFKYDKDVDKLLKRLLDGKNADNLWGWWPGNTTTPWITAHVTEAFLMALEAGYFVELNQENLITYLVSAMDSELPTQSQLGILVTLQRMKARVDYESLTDSLANDLHHFSDSATWMTIRQQAGLEYNLKPLLAQHEKTLFGSIYWGEAGYCLFNNSLMQTMLMYQLLKNDGAYDEWLPRIRTWFFEQRQSGHWGNTYYASRTMATLLPDLLELVKSEEAEALSIQVGGETIAVEKFPYQLELDSVISIQLNKKGTQPIFARLSQKYFNPDPLPRDSDFVIQTHWVKEGERVEQLIAGEKYQLEVKIQVKRKSDYLMLEVPIPAGCSYAIKQTRRWDEAHREYFKERVNIYFHSLQPGHYTKTIEVVPRFTGRLTINPARMEQMYFPVFYGRNAVKKVTVNN
ncbi:MAG: carboxypeptidase-like regulatory domain-containing protein, partial [Marinilabiliaceae bacterium]|nr:carboxypeptidase-like regulatory domain-containing protein [Marinilabiliaceae bacterium]